MSFLKDSPTRWEDFVADEKALKHPGFHPDNAGNGVYRGMCQDLMAGVPALIFVYIRLAFRCGRTSWISKSRAEAGGGKTLGAGRGLFGKNPWLRRLDCFR